MNSANRLPRTLRSAAIPLVLGLTVLPLLASSAAAAAADPTHTVTVTPAANSTLNDFRIPLVGSPLYLVYSDSHVIADSDVRSQDAPQADASSQRLVVRNISGSTTDLGAYPTGDDTWSMSGTTLAAGSESVVAPHEVDYWDVAAGTSGNLTLPTKSLYVAAAPDGVLYVGVSGSTADSVVDHLYLRHFSGTTDDLGVPFAGQVPTVTSGDDGAIVTNGSQAKYLSFVSPSSYVTLAPAGTDLLVCEAVVGNYAACHGEDGDGDLRSDQIIPLDGSAATRTTVSPGDAALSGSTLLWDGTVAGSTTPHMFSLDAGSSAAPTHSTQALGYTGSGPVVTSYGGGVASAAGDSALYLAHSSSDITTVLTAKPSPVSAARFSLTSGRVAYNDDQVQGSSPVSTYSTRFTTSGTTVSLADQTLVKAGSYSNVIGTSGAGSVYAVVTSGQTVSLTVVAPKRTHTITGVVRSARLTLSGNRLLYFTATAKEKAETAHLYNLASGKTTTDGTFSPCCLADQLTALAGNTFAYVKTNNSVWKKDLATGKSVQVEAAPKSSLGTPQVFANGDYVGWAYLAHGSDNPAIKDGYRNVRTMSKPVSVSKRIWQLATTGVVLDNDTTTEFSGGSVDNATSFSFRTYSGRTFSLLGSQRFVQGPQVNGTTVGWIDEHGALKLAPVSVTAAHARYLGDRHTSAGLAKPGTTTYSAYLPYSAPLTSCRVDITHGSSHVVTAPCDSAIAAQGGVSFAWNGTAGGHKVAKGSYTYVVHAAGARGPALNLAGKPAAVSGTIKVG